MDLRYQIYADFYRASGHYSLRSVFWSVFRRHFSGFNYLVAMRVCRALNKRKGPFSRLLFTLARGNFRRIQMKYATDIPWTAEFGPGMLLPHPTGIVVHPNVLVGKNCTILQDVTIGNNLFQDKNRVAIIGDNVTICAGARIIGAVNIGDNVTVGANAVVTKDVEPGCIVAGVPARVIARKAPVLINCDYLPLCEFMAWKEGHLKPPE